MANMATTIKGELVTDQIPEGQYFLTASGSWWQYSPTSGYFRVSERTARCLRVWLRQLKAAGHS